MVKANIFIKNSSDYTDEFKNKVFNLLNDYHKDKINIKKSRIISYCMIYEYLILNSNLNINDIFNHYEERIGSRIAGYYDIYYFFGDDLRFKKR